MAELVEIRWHGRGGQGSKTASILLGKVASQLGMNIQAFPEYGPERMGAPVLAYNRISDGRLTVHCQIEEPGYVVVLDPTLLDTVDVTEGLRQDGKIIVNTEKKPEEIRKELGYEGGQVYTVDANNITRDELGKAFPNTPMLGALVAVSNFMSEEEFMEAIREEFSAKFAHKPEVIEGNMRSIERAFEEVHGE